MSLFPPDQFPDPHPPSAELAASTASELSQMLEDRSAASHEIVELLIARIEAVDHSGPGLRSVLELAPDALDVAQSLDQERRAGRLRGPLHGVPVLVKDNIDTAAPLHTTAGSLVFGDSSPISDAPVVSALRRAGMIVLGKANLSEWACFRSSPASSGWSAAGGQTLNPHALDRSPGGSSSGSGAAVAAGLTPLAVGTETNGSILCPASACGVLGLKPTVGLASRTGIVPISASQDTAGPMAKGVEDLALLLEVLATTGPEDPALSGLAPRDGDPPRLAPLAGDGSLEGVRVGVLRGGRYSGYHSGTDRLFDEAIAAIAGTGAAVVDPLSQPSEPLVSFEDEMIVLAHEFRAGLRDYLGHRASRAAVEGARRTQFPRSVEDVIAHAWKEPAERADVFGVELLERAAAAGELSSETYLRARDANRRRARGDGLDALLSGQQLDVIAVPTMPPAWLIDHVVGDHVLGHGWGPPAIAGYPSTTMPVGRTGGLPVGVTFWGGPWSEPTLLRVMFALERALGKEATRPCPRYVSQSSQTSDEARA